MDKNYIEIVKELEYNKILFNTINKIVVKEIWVDIPTHKDIYQASTFGRIRSLCREGHTGRNLKGIILNQFMSNMYYSVNLCKKDKRKQFSVHQLIAITFLNHTINGFKIVVDHIDFCKTNNNLYNLRLISQRENTSQFHLPSASKYVGVHLENNKFRARININKQEMHLGVFTTEEEASKYYKDALKCVNEEKIDDIKFKKQIYSSKHKGISFHKNNKKWIARIILNKKHIHIGSYNTEQEAYQARKKYKNR